MKPKTIVNIYKAASWLCWKIPTGWSYRLAAVGGEAYYWLNRHHSREADRNMQIVLGEPQINGRVRQVARRSFRNYVKYMVDFLRQPHLKGQEIDAACISTGWKYVEEARQRGKGVMLISPHFGNWDGAATVFTAHGYKLVSVAKDFEPPELNELVQGARRGKGIQIFSLKDAGRGLLSALKNNGMVVLLLDSPLRNEGVVVNFFGQPVRMASGPGTLVYRTGATVMMGYIVRQPGNQTYYGCWEPELKDYELTGEHDHDIQVITQSIANSLEKLVRRHPDQWYMFRHLFLTPEEVEEHHKFAQARNQQKTERKAKISKTAELPVAVGPNGNGKNN